jgi:hypothetical protein
LATAITISYAAVVRANVSAVKPERNRIRCAAGGTEKRGGNCNTTFSVP